MSVCFCVCVCVCFYYFIISEQCKLQKEEKVESVRVCVCVHLFMCVCVCAAVQCRVQASGTCVVYQRLIRITNYVAGSSQRCLVTTAEPHHSRHICSQRPSRPSSPLKRGTRRGVARSAAPGESGEHTCSAQRPAAWRGLSYELPTAAFI